MNDLFDITSEVNDIVMTKLLEDGYDEFCESLDRLDYIIDPEMYLEAVEDKTPSFRRHAKAVKDNTVDTTIDVAQAYGNIVSGNAKFIKSMWDLTMQSIQLLTKVLGFVLSKASEVPKLILKTAKGIGNIPNDVRNKIRGNIKVYITADDLTQIYNETLIQQIDTFISTAASLSQGELWGTFLHKSADVIGGKVYASQNDIKACKNLEKIYDHIRYIEFNPTVVEMQNPKARDLYFGGTKSVQFTDLNGVHFQGTYYEALQKLVTDINSRKTELEKINGLIGKKYNQTQLNQTFAKLHRGDQQRIVRSIQMISKCVSIVGNMTRYVVADMKTINDTTNKILNYKS